MPSLATQLERGDGVFRARLVIAGWPTIYVDSHTLVGVLFDGRVQRIGLDPMTVRISAMADLVRAELAEQGATFELTDDADGHVTRSIAAVPTARCWITSDVSVSATTIAVTSTDGFPSAGAIHIGPEAVRYTGKTVDSFTGCTRGSWNSTALAHFTGDGERSINALVTDRPETMGGRRVSVYLYGSSDSAGGGGTERWRGIVRDAPEYSGGRWSFGAEPISWLLDQSIGGDIVDGVPLRGIYYAHTAAMRFLIELRTSAAGSSAVMDSAEVILSGFFADQAAFCAALQAEIDTAVAGWGWESGSSLSVEPLGTEGWQFVYRTGPTTPRWVSVPTPWTLTTRSLSPVDLLVTEWHGLGTDPLFGMDRATGSVVEGSVYALRVRAPVPRHSVEGVGGYRFIDPSRPENRPGRLYLGGRVVPSLGIGIAVDADRSSIDPSAEDPEVTLTMGASAISTSARWVEIARGGGLDFLGPGTRLHILRTLADGHVGDLLDALVADSPGSSELGAMPLVAAADIVSDWAELEESIAGSGWSDRVWYAGGHAITLRDIIVPELRAVGCYLAPSTTGALSIRRLRTPLRTDVRAATLDEDTVGGALPALSLSPSGHVREVLYRTGWDQVEGEHTGTSIRVRSLAVPSSTSGVLEVAPRSNRVGEHAEEYTVEQAYLLASGVLGLFGRPYRIATFPSVSLASMDACQVGAIVAVESAFLPSLAGEMGLSQVGLVMGYDWSPYEGRGSVSVLLQELETAGYAPGFTVASQTGATTEWTLTVELSPWTDQADVGQWLSAGDAVRVIQRDTHTPTRVAGVVTATPTATTVAVTFAGTWTPGAGEWILSYDVTTALAESVGARGWAQTDFMLIAGADRRLELASGFVDAREFAP